MDLASTPRARVPALALPRIGAIVATRRGHHGAGRARVHPRPADPAGEGRGCRHPSSTGSRRRVRSRRHAGARPDPAAGHLSDPDRLPQGHGGGRGGNRRPRRDRCPLRRRQAFRAPGSSSSPRSGPTSTSLGRSPAATRSSSRALRQERQQGTSRRAVATRYGKLAGRHEPAVTIAGLNEWLWRR